MEVSPIKEILTPVDIDGVSEEIDLAEIGGEEFFKFTATQEELNSLLESGSQGKTVSYALKPLLYTAKYGAKALSAVMVVISYVLGGALYGTTNIVYIPYRAPKILEGIKEKDENTVGYKIITASQNLLDLTSGLIYNVSYVPYSAGVVLNGVSSITNQLYSSLSPEKIGQICTRSDLFIDNLSSKLKGRKTENFSQALAVAC